MAWEYDEVHENFTCAFDMIHLNYIAMSSTNSSKGVLKWFAALN